MMAVSVVMTTFNGATFLEQQIESVLNQTSPPDEIIICDDISKDGTVELLATYQQKGLLRYTVNPQRLGVVQNFKKAVSMATAGNFIALCDQDDEWMPDKLAKSAELLKSIDDPSLPCMVFSDLRYIDQDDKVINQSFWNEFGFDRYRQNLNTLLFNNFVTGCTVLMNSAAAKYFAEIPDDVRVHDEWLALVCFTLGKTAAIAESLVSYRKHQHNASITGDGRADRYKAVLNQLFLAFKGDDHFLADRIAIVKRFYQQYYPIIPDQKKSIFEGFLSLENKSYFKKKLAFNGLKSQFKPLQ